MLWHLSTVHTPTTRDTTGILLLLLAVHTLAYVIALYSCCGR
jgi:hypothetical protein